MAKRSMARATYTPSIFATGANLTDSTYGGALVGGAAAQKVAISEVYIGGQATASAPMYMMFARCSTAAATLGTPTTSDTPLDSSATALASVTLAGDVWTTKPQASTSNVLNLSFNAFGGVVRWVAYPGEEIWQVGSSNTTGCHALYAFTGSNASGTQGSHIIFEAT